MGKAAERLVKVCDDEDRGDERLTAKQTLSRRHWCEGFLFLMAVSFALAVVMPTPSLNELNHTYGDVASVGASKNNRDTQLQLGKIGNQMMFLVHGLSLEETEKVRSISPGTRLEIWYWDPPFGLEFDVWQLKEENEIIVPYENRLLEFQLTQMLMVGAGVIMGVIAFFPYLRSRNAK